jgi:hypothetical protein
MFEEGEECRKKERNEGSRRGLQAEGEERRRKEMNE